MYQIVPNCTKLLAFAKFSLILIAMFLIPLENYAQECANSGLSNQSASNDCKKISLDPENLASLPVKVVKVNFHWVTNQQDQNFTPDGSNNTINGVGLNFISFIQKFFTEGG